MLFRTKAPIMSFLSKFESLFHVSDFSAALNNLEKQLRGDAKEALIDEAIAYLQSLKNQKIEPFSQEMK